MNTPLLPRPLSALIAVALLHVSALAQVPAPGATDPATTPPSATPAPKPFSPAEKNLIKGVGKSLYYEIQLATAGKNAAVTDEKYVRFRDTTIRDLNKAWEGLNKVAKGRGEMLSGELTGADKTGVERLGKLKDEKFLKQWLEDLTKEAKKLDRDFESGARIAQDPELKTYFANYTPIMHTVFTSAETAEKGLKKK